MKKLCIAIVTLLGGNVVNAATAPLTPEQQLGSLLYQDKNLSLNHNQACASCHSLKPITVCGQNATSFVDPDNVKKKTPVSSGSQVGAFGGLNAPSAGYAAFSPPFHLDNSTGMYVGGQFWNGRAADLVAQAKGPLLNPLEMAMPSAWAVIERLKTNARYVKSFKQLYNINISTIPAYNPQAQAPALVDVAYDRLAHAIAEFEKSPSFYKFNSKFDFVTAGLTKFSKTETQGKALFEGKAKCSTCHTSDIKVDANGKKLPPLFTDFTYDNVGVPYNSSIPNLPAANLGLGGRADIAANDANGLEIGKHKVATLRNIALTAPYGHNGVFKDLAQVVHFYNTRDTLGVVASSQDAGFGMTGWPVPEVPNNLNVTELGHLGLSATEEKALVAFLKTLTDDYPVWGNDVNVPAGTVSPYTPINLPAPIH
jgi:cytochrome c peroxidase